jgi:hypothetical protein
MIKYNIIPTNNRYYLHHKNLYLLKSRNTYYGVHSENFMTEIDPICSKTAILVFIYKKDAIKFKQILDKQQNTGKTYNRIVNDFSSKVVSSNSIFPLEIEEIDTDKLRILSYLHFFNLYMINDIIKRNKDIEIYGTEVSTYEYPNREMIEYLLYKSL